MKKIVCLLAVLVGLAVTGFFSSRVFCAEHPGEHPGTEAKGQPGVDISAEEIREAINNYIKKDTELKGGFFYFYDTESKKTLQLVLEKVHDRVSIIKKEKAYFACSDFNVYKSKTKYDLDFWMKKDKHGKLEVYKIAVHKLDGKPRFTYKDDEVEVCPTKEQCLVK